MGLGIALVIILIIFLLLILASCIKIVPQAQALIIERLGAYMGTRSCSLMVWRIPLWLLRI